MWVDKRMGEAASCVSARHRTIPRREAELADNHMAITEREICLKATTNDNRSLLYMENLTLPSVGLVLSAIRSP